MLPNRPAVPGATSGTAAVSGKALLELGNCGMSPTEKGCRKGVSRGVAGSAAADI